MTTRILTISPGSTSTKIGLFDDADMVFSVNLKHDANDLSGYSRIIDQLPFRKQSVLLEVESRNIDLHEVDVFVGRGGLSYPVEGGTYGVNDLLLEDLQKEVSGKHPSNLGAIIAHDLSQDFGGRAYIVNPVVVDELSDVARLTGLKDIPRTSILHALNQKETAIRFSNEIGKKYAEQNFVVAHLGGGISISSHRQGRIVDTTNALNGDGPMAPTRSGDLPATPLIDLCFSGKYTQAELYALVTKRGGLIDHLGTDDMVEVLDMIASGDQKAKQVYEAMVYQIGKYIGAYAAALNGEVDYILLTGGLAHDQQLTQKVTQMVRFIAPVRVFPGEFELEAMACGALRVLSGEEAEKQYRGKPMQ